MACSLPGTEPNLRVRRQREQWQDAVWIATNRKKEMGLELPFPLQVRPCGIFFRAVPILGERTFAQKCRFVQPCNRLVQNQDQSATCGFDLDRFQNMDLS